VTYYNQTTFLQDNTDICEFFCIFIIK